MSIKWIIDPSYLICRENIRCSSAKEAPIILFGKDLKDLPCYELGYYSIGPETVLNACTGPDGGLTSVNKSQKHLSIADPEIDFIDIHDDQQNESKFLLLKP